MNESPSPSHRPRQQAPVISSPAGVRQEIVLHDVAASPEHLWVPQSEGVSFLPLCFGVTQGYYVNLLRVRRSGVLSCHRHTGSVHAQVMKGSWYYLEHDWVAREGSFILETPGETHTLVVPPDVDEMITWFHVSGSYIYLDGSGAQIGFEDVFTKLERARAHFERLGVGSTYVDGLIR